MDEDDTELVRRLMAKATVMLEEAIEAAVAGQSPHAAPDELLDGARRLHAAGLDIAAVARAAVIISTAGVAGSADGRNRTS